MRIVFVISHLIYGGAETQMIGLSRELARMGHAVAIYTLNRENPRASELAGSGVRLVADQKRMKLDPAVIMRLRRFVRDYQADVVHSFLFDADVYARIAGMGLGIPVFNSERNDDYRLNFLQRLIHWPTRNLARAVIANSQSGARFAQGLFGFATDRVHCVWNGVDLARIDQRVGDCQQDYRVEFFGDPKVKMACLVGSIKPQKDYLLAMQVAEELLQDRPDWRVLFVGDQLKKTGEYKSSVMEAYQGLTSKTRIHFAGLRKDVAEILSQCDAVFSTSLHEGFPNVVLEAMSVGTPVVSTAYSDIEQILPCSWQVVPDRDAAKLAQVIVRAAAERDVVATRQRRWVETHATLAVAAQNLLKTYGMYSANRGVDCV
jgi:glycosyltransferase involved in cell wall biosynthesis